VLIFPITGLALLRRGGGPAPAEPEPAPLTAM
jgi:hypothetical protein